MKFTTFYFSGTGNTRWAVTEFARIIEEKGHQADVVSIDIQTGLSDAQLRAMVAEAGAITIDGIVADPQKFPRFQGPTV